MNKIFIIGLPRTGTTSISVALLDHGFKVAHTAFTQQAFKLADVVSDAPCFSDYQQLDALFPGSKFIYLERSQDLWIPSIQKLLKKMKDSLEIKTGVFNPVLKRAFHTTFELSTATNSLDAQHLENCYQQHKDSIRNYFEFRDDLLEINISQRDSFSTLLQFLNIDFEGEPQFPHLNIGKHVSNWREHKHPNKVNSNAAGVHHRKFFDYL